MEKLLYTTKEAANILGIPVKELKSSQKTGKIDKRTPAPRITKLGAKVRYHRHDLFNFVNSLGSKQDLVSNSGFILKNRLKAKSRVVPPDDSDLKLLVSYVQTTIKDCCASKHDNSFDLRRLKIVRETKFVPVGTLKRILRNKSRFTKRLKSIWHDEAIADSTKIVIDTMIDRGLLETEVINSIECVSLIYN